MPQRKYHFYVYIMASRSHDLYVGFTNNIFRRIAEHRTAPPGTYTARYNINRLVQSHAMNSWKNDLIFREEIAKVPEITARLSPEKLARAFDYNRQLANVDAIFDRVLNK